MHHHINATLLCVRVWTHTLQEYSPGQTLILKEWNLLIFLSSVKKLNENIFWLKKMTINRLTLINKLIV